MVCADVATGIAFVVIVSNDMNASERIEFYIPDVFSWFVDDFTIVSVDVEASRRKGIRIFVLVAVGLTLPMVPSCRQHSCCDGFVISKLLPPAQVLVITSIGLYIKTVPIHDGEAKHGSAILHSYTIRGS